MSEPERLGYRPTIGLEIHAELNTRTKMFCDSPNDPSETRPNVNTCPVCLAHPGTLPVINRQAVAHVLRVGSAIGGKLADYSEFDRKSYFYPDIPKGYQISQFAYPLVKGGMLAGIPVTRIHLEEDTARSTHVGATGTETTGVSLVDFNRAGVPLMELVTEPAIADAETAGRFARELQLLLRTLGASHANLEKGEMRIEANVSVSKDGTLAKKYVEVKNINSFRSVERAIAYEIDRQITLIESGGAVEQETRGWDEGAQKTFSQRLKEGSADYRYFPEPDLPKLLLSEIPEFHAATIASQLPELPWERQARYEALGLREEDAMYITATLARGTFFDTVVELVDNNHTLVQLAANYMISDLAGWYAKHGGVEFELVSPPAFASLVRMLAEGKLSSRGAKDVLAQLALKGGDPESIMLDLGLMQVNDSESLLAAVREVVSAHPGPVEEYRAGKESVLQFLLGQCMKATKGAGNPAALRDLLLAEMQKK